MLTCALKMELSHLLYLKVKSTVHRSWTQECKVVDISMNSTARIRIRIAKYFHVSSGTLCKSVYIERSSLRRYCGIKRLKLTCERILV